MPLSRRANASSRLDAEMVSATVIVEGSVRELGSRRSAPLQSLARV